MVTRVLDACHPFPGFVYGLARLIKPINTIEIDAQPHRSVRPRCSCCRKPGPGYDVLPV